MKNEQPLKQCSGKKFVMPPTIAVGNEAFTNFIKVMSLPGGMIAGWRFDFICKELGFTFPAADCLFFSDLIAYLNSTVVCSIQPFEISPIFGGQCSVSGFWDARSDNRWTEPAAHKRLLVHELF